MRQELVLRYVSHRHNDSNFNPYNALGNIWKARQENKKPPRFTPEQWSRVRLADQETSAIARRYGTAFN